MDETTLQKVEAQRAELEANIIKLKKSLHHWQTLELDYECLREEFDLLPEDTSPEGCLKAARDFEPALVDEKDLRTLIPDATSSKTPQQLAHVLSRRVEYVAKNAETIRKQIVDAEKKRNALLLVEDPDHRDDAGLPLTEITEELDESGNVVSSRVERPGVGAAGLLEVLDKAGVDGVKQSGSKPTRVEELVHEEATPSTKADASATKSLPDDAAAAGDESSLDDTTPPSTLAEAAHQSPGAERDASRPTFDPFDTAEEARLREEMLNYQGVDDMRAIVAELDLAEGSSDASYDPDDDDVLLGSDFDEDDEDESEDETGQAKNPAVPVTYRDKMEKLKKSLGLDNMENLGPDPKLPPEVKKELGRPPAAEAARKAAIARQENSAKSALRSVDDENATITKKKPKKKSVAFAESLDVAEEQPPTKRAKLPVRNKDKEEVNPLSESVIERSEAAEADAPPPPAPISTTSNKKVSRFKKDKQAAAQPPTTTNPSPQQPQPRPLVATIVLERPSSSKISSHLPPDPTTIDDELHRKDLALEYHKLRNRRIHDQGGFTDYRDEDGDEEDFDDAMQDWGVVDPVTGEWRKVSRFKAARVRG